MDSNTHHNYFPILHFVSTYTLNSKLQVVYRRSTDQMTELDVSYGSKHALQSLSNKPFVCTYTHKSKTIGHTPCTPVYECSAYRTTALQLETFLKWLRVAWEIQLESYDPRHALVILWYTIVCIYCKPCIHRDLVGNYTWQQNPQTLWLHTTHQTMAFLPMMHHFTCVRAKLASYTTHRCVFSINRVH